MTVERHSEYCSLGGAELAGRYRPSYNSHSRKNLLSISFFYGLCAGFFLGVFMIKNRIELLLNIPSIALLFAWCFHMGLSACSVAEHPEKLHKHKDFMAFFVLVGLLFWFSMVVDIPQLNYFLLHHKISEP